MDDFHVFELAAVVKKFFREMPQPLLTFELYDDFIRTSEVTDDQERLQYMFSLFQRLPPENYDLLERLMNHLAMLVWPGFAVCFRLDFSSLWTAIM